MAGRGRVRSADHHARKQKSSTVSSSCRYSQRSFRRRRQACPNGVDHVPSMSRRGHNGVAHLCQMVLSITATAPALLIIFNERQETEINPDRHKEDCGDS